MTDLTENTASNASDNQGNVLALFDLDHTLLDVDSDYLWGEYVVTHKLVDEDEYRRLNQMFYDQYIAGTLDATEYNEFVAKFLTTLPLERLHELREDYIRYEIEPHIRPKALSVLKEHLALGHTVVIISATNDFVVSAIAERFEVPPENVLATPLEIIDERYTGRLTDKPNFQAGKLYHLEKWLNKKLADGIKFDTTYAYSDSKNDIPLLDWADIAVCVSPDDALHAHALANRWAVEDWAI